MRKIAVVGSGISGIGAAWLLRDRYDVTLYESDNRLGGHSNTIDIDTPAGPMAVDTGFIVYNERNYPHLTSLFRHLGIATEQSDMSFAVSEDNGRLEWAGDSVRTVFAQRRNLLRPSFLRMLRQIGRFNRLAPLDLESGALEGRSLGTYLDDRRFSDPFRRSYLLPMGGAIWSTPIDQMIDFPAESFVRFFVNHALVSRDRPAWRTVSGGSRMYVAKLAGDLTGRIRAGIGVRRVERRDGGIRIFDQNDREEDFDAIILATHSDHALRMLADPSTDEKAVLGRIKYAPNRVFVHCDPALMPKRRAIWASWNYMSFGLGSGVCVSYWMNRLQNLERARPVFITLNPPEPPKSNLLYREMRYDHVQFDMHALGAQKRLGMIQGRRNTWFCGAWTGYGFHEDGLRSAIDIAAQFGVVPPWRETASASRLSRAAA